MCMLDMLCKIGSLYMIDVAKDNPQLAQKLHHVLVESGVVAPRNLISEIYDDEFGSSTETNELSLHLLW